MAKRWVVLPVLITVLVLGAACSGQAAAPGEPAVEGAPPAEQPEVGETEPEATLAPDAEVVEAAGLNLVDSTVCDEFTPPTSAPITPVPGSLAEVRADDWTLGPDDAAVTFLTYSDFQ